LTLKKINDISHSQVDANVMFSILPFKLVLDNGGLGVKKGRTTMMPLKEELFNITTIGKSKTYWWVPVTFGHNPPVPSPPVPNPCPIRAQSCP
jgi:hypothetical protein